MLGRCHGRGHIRFCIGWNCSANLSFAAAPVLS
jgi:hypothetical protein